MHDKIGGGGFENKKCLVLVSGGVDSGVLLWWAKSRKLRLATLSFLFPGRRQGELSAMRQLRKASGSRENFDLELPFVDPPRSERNNYIPQRNLMYYGIAASIAEKIQASYILGGHIQHDGIIFPDARSDFFKSLEGLVHRGQRDHARIELVFPFIGSEKKDIIKLGASLGFPFELTWSCSNDAARPCWNCYSCQERIMGFFQARVTDPLWPE